MYRDVLDYYAAPGRFTALTAGEFCSADVGRVVEVVQGLLVYDLAAGPFYGVELAPAQLDAVHERDSAALLALVRALDPAPIDQARSPAGRVGARCHAFSRLTVALLRAAGVPARARCGFGTYFRPGLLEDHWVAEVWDAGESRWRMVDAQLDATWRAEIGYRGDPLAITATEFVTAGHAWQAWRRGELDADTCGLSGLGQHGAFWIAGNLRADLASLNKVEMLPWDLWGARLEPGATPTDAQLRLFDEVAALTTDADGRFAALRDRYETDASLRVPASVLNALRDRVETV